MTLRVSPAGCYVRVWGGFLSRKTIMTTAETDLGTICYKQNFLKEVIARIDLVSPVEAIGKELPKTIAKQHSRSFPSTSQSQHSLKNFSFCTRNGYEEKRIHGMELLRQITGKTSRHHSTSSLRNLYKYEKYERFREEFCSIVDTFFAINKEAQPSRLGLRYIDELKLPGENPLDWNEYISPRTPNHVRIQNRRSRSIANLPQP